jgi:hypothetical protein
LEGVARWIGLASWLIREFPGKNRWIVFVNPIAKGILPGKHRFDMIFVPLATILISVEIIMVKGGFAPLNVLVHSPVIVPIVHKDENDA